jgi:radical SAM superfamily enzyme YgiQ (UPF0313 family)
MSFSRGCNWNKCVFCQELFTEAKDHNLNYRVRSPEHVIEEIIQAVKKLKVAELQFDNVQFPNEKKWLLRFKELLEKNNLKIKWSCLSRITAFDFETLKILKSLGCYSILFGIESFDQQILNFLKKGHTEKQIKATIKNCQRLGIKTTGSFLMGVPGENPLTVFNYAFKAALLGIDYFQLFIVKWYANPPEKIVNEYKISRTWSFSKYDFYGPIFVPPSYKSILHMKYVQKISYLIFYFHPFTIIRYLLRIRSFSDFKKIFSAALILKRMN